ncbi:Mce/MlaD domain-containing protein [Bordetella sputigena]|uniref:MlaD family protein n=1 Tax=Bordetella sputigena TaxID=1416810 RepID=UPI0039EF7803
MKRNALLVGAFVIASVAIMVAAILWLSGSDFFAPHQNAKIYYEGNVTGLTVGSPVTFRGVKVGQVTDVGIQVDTQSLATTIPVSVKLQSSAMRLRDGSSGAIPDLPTLVRRGLRARLTSQSIVTGQKAIELDFLPDTPATLLGSPGEAEIPALRDRFGALIEQVADLPLRDMSNDVRAAVQDLRSAASAMQGALGTASTELKLTAEQSRVTLKTAADAIVQLERSSTKTLQSVQALADVSRRTVVSAQPELMQLLGEARKASTSANLAMARLADITSPEAPLRNDLESTLRDLAQAARGLRSLADLLEDKPNALIFGNAPE